MSVWVHHHQVCVCGCVCGWVSCGGWSCVCVYFKGLLLKTLNVHVVRVLLQSVLCVAGLKDGPNWRIPHHWQFHDQRYNVHVYSYMSMDTLTI